MALRWKSFAPSLPRLPPVVEPLSHSGVVRGTGVAAAHEVERLPERSALTRMLEDYPVLHDADGVDLLAQPCRRPAGLFALSVPQGPWRARGPVLFANSVSILS